MKDNIKLLVTYSNTINCIECGKELYEKYFKNNKIFVPILGGKSLYKGNNEFLKSLQGDNDGKNLSILNPNVNEMTVIYWAFANQEKLENFDYIGFNHYRRRFTIPENEETTENTIFVNKMDLHCPQSTYFLINHAPDTVRIFTSFLYKYIRSLNQTDLHLLLAWLNQPILYSQNLFIMNKKWFNEYGNELIKIMNILLPEIYSFPNIQDRSAGFILERMTGFIIWKLQQIHPEILVKQGKYEVLEGIM